MSAASSEAISLSWESPPVTEVACEERNDRVEVESLGGSAAVRKRRAQALVAEWRRGDIIAGERIRRMLETGDGETRLALVEALPNAVSFEVVESALKGMGQSFLGGSAQTERRGWTVVTALLGAGLLLDLLIVLNSGRGYTDPSSLTLAVILATSPGLVAWQVMCIHRRIQTAIDTQRQQQYYARVATIARKSLYSDPTQYAQPVLHRLEEMAPVVELESKVTLASSARRSPCLVTISGLISIIDASVSMNAL
jgi:hypothetical protein